MVQSKGDKREGVKQAMDHGQDDGAPVFLFLLLFPQPSQSQQDLHQGPAKYGERSTVLCG